MSNSERFLRRPDVEHRVGLRRTTIYRMISAGEFPRPVVVGGASVWPESEVTDWMARQVARRNAAQTPPRRGARRRAGLALFIDPA